MRLAATRRHCRTRTNARSPGRCLPRVEFHPWPITTFAVCGAYTGHCRTGVGAGCPRRSGPSRLPTSVARWRPCAQAEYSVWDRLDSVVDQGLTRFDLYMRVRHCVAHIVPGNERERGGHEPSRVDPARFPSRAMAARGRNRRLRGAAGASAETPGPADRGAGTRGGVAGSASEGLRPGVTSRIYPRATSIEYEAAISHKNSGDQPLRRNGPIIPNRGDRIR